MSWAVTEPMRPHVKHAAANALYMISSLYDGTIAVATIMRRFQAAGHNAQVCPALRTRLTPPPSPSDRSEEYGTALSDRFFPPLAEAGQTCGALGTPRTDLQLVHRRLRHQGPERGKGAARRVVMSVSGGRTRTRREATANERPLSSELGAALNRPVLAASRNILRQIAATCSLPQIPTAAIPPQADRPVQQGYAIWVVMHRPIQKRQMRDSTSRREAPPFRYILYRSAVHQQSDPV